MRLDAATLTLVSTTVIGLQGLLLLYSWMQNRDSKALAWWGANSALVACGFALLLMRGTVPVWISVTAGHALIFLSLALFWTGFRVFESRPPRLFWILAGPTLWLAACSTPTFYKSLEARTLLASGILVPYLLAAGWEIWRGRHEPLGSRYPIMALIGVHIVAVMWRIFLAAPPGDGGEMNAHHLAFLTNFAFESLVFAVAVSFLALNLTKERVEAELRAIATRDPLTGALNRRAFLERARDLLDRGRRTCQPCALVVADLDHFKGINDRFGHAAGDQVLKGLPCIAAEHLPGGALTVRLGGEEFGFLIVGTQATATVLAERLRAGLEATRFETQHEAFSATVSLGVATTEDVGHILDAMMAAADVALYRAKALGRNRVEITGVPEAEPTELSEYEKLSLAA